MCTFQVIIIDKASTEMAGNIIPAIATTNAMTAALCVLQSLKVFQNDLMHTKMVRIEQRCLFVLKLTGCF